jgi:hypothetical protein
MAGAELLTASDTARHRSGATNGEALCGGDENRARFNPPRYNRPAQGAGHVIMVSRSLPRGLCVNLWMVNGGTPDLFPA